MNTTIVAQVKALLPKPTMLFKTWLAHPYTVAARAKTVWAEILALLDQITDAAPALPQQAFIIQPLLLDGRPPTIRWGGEEHPPLIARLQAESVGATWSVTMDGQTIPAVGWHLIDGVQTEGENVGLRFSPFWVQQQ